MNSPYIRKKGKKFILEYKDAKNKTKYLKTLPNAEILYLLSCQDALIDIASQYLKKFSYVDTQRFGQLLLTELLNLQDIRTHDLDEDTSAKLWELTK